MCISRMYVKCCSTGSVEVRYISSHTNHDLTLEQAKFVPLPKDVKDNISLKLNQGIPIERILDGKYMYMYIQHNYTVHVHPIV